MFDFFFVFKLDKTINNNFFDFFFSYSEDLNTLSLFNIEKNFLFSNDIFIFPLSKVFCFDSYSFFFQSFSREFKLLSFFKGKFFLFIKSYLNGFFIEFRIFGLGFKIKRVTFIERKAVLIDLGFSHFFKLIVPFNFKIFKAKRRFFFFTNDFFFFKVLLDFFKHFRLLSKYKFRGFKLVKQVIKLKSVKKQKRK